MYLPIWGEVQRLQELHRERNQSWTSAFHSCNKSRAWLDVMGELAINVMGERAHQAWPSAWEQSGLCQGEAGRSASRAGGGALSGPCGELGLVPDADPVGQAAAQGSSSALPGFVRAARPQARVGTGGNSCAAAGLPCYSLARGLTFQLSVLSDWAPIPPLQTSNYRAAVPPVSSVLIPVLSSQQQGALRGSRPGRAQHTLPELGGNSTTGKTKQSKARASTDLQSLPRWSRKVLKDL